MTQMRVPRSGSEAREMLEFWMRNTVEQIDKTVAAGWSAADVLAMARAELARVLRYVERMEEPTPIGLDELESAVAEVTRLANEKGSWHDVAAELGISAPAFAMARDYAQMVSASLGLTQDKVFGMGVMVGLILGRKS